MLIKWRPSWKTRIFILLPYLTPSLPSECRCTLKYFLSIHYCIITLHIPPFIFQISIPASSVHSVSLHPPSSLAPSLCSHSSPLFHHLPLFLFLGLFSHPITPHSPLFPSLLPTASQMDRMGVGLSTPANQSDPPRGAASLHYGYIRMNVSC